MNWCDAVALFFSNSSDGVGFISTNLCDGVAGILPVMKVQTYKENAHSIVQIYQKSASYIVQFIFFMYLCSDF